MFTLYINNFYTNMKLYQFLSRIGFLKKYSAKFMFIAFLGMHIPLLGIIVFLILSSGSPVDRSVLFLLTLGLTLLATGITLFILNALTLPLSKTQHSLREYINNNSIPNLPAGHTDELGLLMHDINRLGQKDINQEKEQMTLTLIQLRASAVNLSAQLELTYGNNIVKETEPHIRMINEALTRQTTK